MKRCTWSTHTENEMAYHDTEWGKPNHDDRYLFEMLNLEGQQAGLSWSTILSKRDTMRAAYANFEPSELVKFTEADVDRLLLDAGIIRHRLKIQAVIHNAHAYQDIVAKHGSLDAFLWAYVDNAPLENNVQHYTDVPAETDLSKQISKDLRKLGFKFVGPTTVYAFMQAVGMVNDHENDCAFRYK